MTFDVNNYIKLLSDLDAYDNEACRIFDKLLKAEISTKAKVLEFGPRSTVERIQWDCADKDAVCIRYYDSGYDLYNINFLYIPVEIFGNEVLIDKWINSKIEETLSKQKAEKEKKQATKEAHEKAEYERLKAKFGN